MVTYITEKLQKQKLDDVQFEPISYERQLIHDIWKQAQQAGSPGTCHVTGEKDWALYVKNSDHRRPKSTDGTFVFRSKSTDIASAACPFDPNSIGHHWTTPPPAAAMTVGDNMGPRGDVGDNIVTPRGVGDNMEMPRDGVGDNRSRSVGAMLPPKAGDGELRALQRCVLHNKPLLFCDVCDTTPGTPPHDPPTKRVCRSKSIPGDSSCGIYRGGTKSPSGKWQPKAGSIWKPVSTLRSHHQSKHKSRHSPHVLHKPKARRASPACSSNSSMASHMSTQGHLGSHGSLSGVLSNNQSGGGVHSNHSVSNAAAISRYSPGGILKFADHVATPSHSPVPRPASASSGFYDSSASQTSLNTSWTEGFFNSQGCFSPPPPPTATTRSNAFTKSRSLSSEEPAISWTSSLSQPLPPLSPFRGGGSGATLAAQQFANASGSMPIIFTGSSSSITGCAANTGSTLSLSGIGAANTGSAGSGFTGTGSSFSRTGNSGVHSVPSSPRRQRVPRCRSQPCVLNERKHGGLKRRLDCDRPAIDFRKMSESFTTATTRPSDNSSTTGSSVHCARPKSVTFAQEIQEIGNSRNSTSPYSDYTTSFHTLDTIASSPLDTTQPLPAAIAPQRTTFCDTNVPGQLQKTAFITNYMDPSANIPQARRTIFPPPPPQHLVVGSTRTSFMAAASAAVETAEMAEEYSATPFRRPPSLNFSQQQQAQQQQQLQQRSADVPSRWAGLSHDVNHNQQSRVAPVSQSGSSGLFSSNITKSVQGQIPRSNHNSSTTKSLEFSTMSQHPNQGTNNNTTNAHHVLNSAASDNAVHYTLISHDVAKLKDAHTPEIQWDSGCSDTNDPPDLISFGESENSCSYDDHSVIIDEETSQQFELEMGSELDLEQIEKD